MYFRYPDGSLIQLVQARYARTDPQILTQYHVPLTDQNGAIALGQDWQTWVISGVIADPMSIRWHDIVMLSLDNISWRTCRVQVPAFPSNMYQQSLYELTVLVSPILEGPVVRYPSSGYKWGNQSITGISQAGNVNAFPIIHYLAPLFYAPLSNTLIDFAGNSVTFTRTASKVHAGATYPINTPIFDNGLYLSSDTAQDVATWTPPASTLRTVVMQIKSKAYPSSWVTGAGAGTANLLTANQSNAETNTTGMEAYQGTLTRNTTTPLVGAGDFKVVATGGDMPLYTTANPAVSAGVWYSFQALLKTANISPWRVCNVSIMWKNAGGGNISRSSGETVFSPAVPTIVGIIAQAPAGAVAASCEINVAAAASGEILYADSLMLEAIPVTSTIWNGNCNNLSIDTANNLLKWLDGATTVSATFPTAAYLAGAVVEIVVIEDTAHAVTVVVHYAGTWYTGSGTLAAITWVGTFGLGYSVGLPSLQGSIANLIEYPYALIDTEYTTFVYSSLSLLYNTLFIGNRYAGEIIKGSDKRLLNANGSDISALLGGVDIPIGASAVTIARSQGLSARWYVEVKRTDV